MSGGKAALKSSSESLGKICLSELGLWFLLREGMYLRTLIAGHWEGEGGHLGSSHGSPSPIWNTDL